MSAAVALEGRAYDNPNRTPFEELLGYGPNERDERPRDDFPDDIIADSWVTAPQYMKPAYRQHFETTPDEEEPLLRSIQLRIGDDRTLRFWRWVHETGRVPGRSWKRTKYILGPGRLRPDHPLVHVVGSEAAELICDHLRTQMGGGTHISVANMNFQKRSTMDGMLLALAAEGMSAEEAAAILSRTWPVSPTTVREKWRAAFGSIARKKR